MWSHRAKPATWVYLPFWGKGLLSVEVWKKSFKTNFTIDLWSAIWEEIGAWEAFFRTFCCYFLREPKCYDYVHGNFEWAYLKSGILDIIFGSYFQTEWLQIYIIHCSICVQRKKHPSVWFCLMAPHSMVKIKKTKVPMVMSWGADRWLPQIQANLTKFMSQTIIFTWNLVFN